MRIKKFRLSKTKFKLLFALYQFKLYKKQTIQNIIARNVINLAHLLTEADVDACSLKRLFREILHYSLENTCDDVFL